MYQPLCPQCDVGVYAYIFSCSFATRHTRISATHDACWPRTWHSRRTAADGIKAPLVLLHHVRARSSATAHVPQVPCESRLLHFWVLLGRLLVPGEHKRHRWNVLYSSALSRKRLGIGA